MNDLPLTERLALSAAQVGQLVGVSETTIRRLVADGTLARVPHTQRLLIARAELDKWLATTGSAS